MRTAPLVMLLLAACAGEGPRDAAALACTPLSVAGHPKADAFAEVLSKALVAGLPGIAALVRTPEGTWVGSAGFADLSLRAPMQPCTLSRVGSVSKTYTALLVLRLVDRGLVDLDRPIAVYLGASDLHDIANADRATVRQLLSHTSGIAHGLDNTGIALAYLFNDPTTTRDLHTYLDGIRGLPAAFPVGQGWGYSNSNYNLLGLMIESVTGRAFADALRVEVLEPLQLDASSFGTAAGVARGYLDQRGDGTLVDTSDFSLGVKTPAGGVVSNVLDVATLMEAAAREPRLAAWVDVSAERAVTPGQTGYGLGLMRWHTDWGDAVGHAGVLFGWESRVWVFPQRQATVVLLDNAYFGVPTKRLRDAEQALLRAAFE
jgi:D-alanyl-D-alanine carboxypeptidase